MGRSPCCSKVGLTRGPWSTKEDTLLTNFIQQHGEGQWRSLPKKAGLLRCGKSCRLRWMNYLRPGIVRGNISPDEEDLIVRLHGLLGNRWSLIAGRLPGRTDNEIKNYWNTHLLKKLLNAADADSNSNSKPARHRQKPKKKAASDPHQSARTKGRKEEEEEKETKTKIYHPKPIRISSDFPRTDSRDSLAGSGSCSSDRAENKNDYLPTVWPVFELEDVVDYQGGRCGGEDDFFGGGGGYCVMPRSRSEYRSDVILLDQVYDEYLQLLG